MNTGKKPEVQRFYVGDDCIPMDLYRNKPYIVTVTMEDGIKYYGVVVLIDNKLHLLNADNPQ